MNFSTPLLAAALMPIVCLAFVFGVMILASLKEAAARDEARAEMLHAKVFCEVQKNPPRAQQSLWQHDLGESSTPHLS